MPHRVNGGARPADPHVLKVGVGDVLGPLEGGEHRVDAILRGLRRQHVLVRAADEAGLPVAV
eukprot:8367902-Alexandrium_andersonii.AAC.1